MKIKLKPCPFCGNKAVEISTWEEIEGREDEEGNDTNYSVNCNYNEGGCGATGTYRTNKQSAADYWNRRSNGDKNAD